MKTSNAIIAILSAALILLLAIDANAQIGMGEIRGTITDSLTGQPIDGVTVSMLYKGYPKIEVTDVQGSYAFKQLEPGTYSLTYQVFGQKPFTQQGIIVYAEGIKFVDMQMANGIMIKGPEIHADNIDIKKDPGIHTITSVDILHGSGGRGVGDVITGMIPGVTAVGNNNKQLSIRGSRPDATQYIIDGVKVIGEPYIPQMGIEQVTVITGGLPAQYGDTTGGVVIITTKGYH